MNASLKVILLTAVAAETSTPGNTPNTDDLMKGIKDLEGIDKGEMETALKNLTETLGNLNGGKDGAEGMPDMAQLLKSLGGENGEGMDLEKLMASMGDMGGLGDSLKNAEAASETEIKEADKEADEDDDDFDKMDQEEILKSFENEPEEPALEAQVSASASHILVETEEEAKKLIEEIGDSEELFAEKAKAVSKCPSGKEGGVLGSFGRGQMVPEFDTAVFDDTTEVGKVVPDPVKTSFGYHVLRVASRGKAGMARASHILVKTEEKANELKEKIAGDKVEFMKTALKESDCPSGKQGGKLGEFSRGQMVAEFENVVFSEETKIGEIVGPIKTSFGFHLVLVTDRVEAEDAKADEEAKEAEAVQVAKEDL